MTSISFKTQFLRQLNNEDSSLENRLLMGYGALISPEFPLKGKEQVIIDWICDCLQSNVNRRKLVVKTLLKMLSTEHLLTYSETIDASKLIEVIAVMDDGAKLKHRKSLFKSLMFLLKNTGVRRYCRFDIQPMIQAVLLSCEFINIIDQNTDIIDESTIDTDNSSLVSSHLEDLFECISHVYKITQQRSELKLRFVKYLLPAFLTFKYDYQESATFQSLFQEVIISDDLEIICKAFKSNASGKIPEHIKVLVKLMVENPNHSDVLLLYSLLLDVSFNNNLKKSGAGTLHLSLFLTLSAVAGFKFQLPYETIESSYETHFKLGILGELTSVLHKHNIPSATEFDEGALSHFLADILKQLISEELPLSPERLKAIQSVLRVYPESVKSVFPGFVQNVMYVRKDAIKVLNNYSDLLIDVIKIFSNMNQLEKFFSLFFSKSVMLSKGSRLANISSEMVLSSGFYSALSEKLATLTGNQLKLILARLTKTFTKDVLYQLEGDSTPDSGFHLVLRLMVQVLCHILNNASIVASTRWNIVKTELNNLILAVQRFGNAVMKSCEIEFATEFVQLVRVLMDIELTAKRYIVSLDSVKMLPVVKCKDKTKSIHSLAKTHGFLSPSEWNRLAEHVYESYDNQLKHCWYDLLIQKYVETGDSEVIKHLVLTADCDWLWQTVRRMSGSVSLKQLELYTEQLLGGDCLSGFEDKLTSLSSVNVMTNRTLRAALSVQSLKQMSRTLQAKRAMTTNMMKLVDFNNVVKHEAEDDVGGRSQELTTVTNALAEVMSKGWGQEEAAVLDNEAREHLARLINLLTVLSPHYLKTDSKRIVFLLLMSLSHDLKGEEQLLLSVLELIIGVMDDGGCVIPESLDRRILLSWLSTNVPDSYTLRPDLVQLALSKVVFSLDHRIESISQVLLADHLLLSILLETFVKVHGNKGIKEREDFLKLVKFSISSASSVVVKKPKEKLLRLYTAALKAEHIIFKKISKSLLQCLQDYLDILFKRFMENSIVEPNATELIELAVSMKTEVDAETTRFVYTSMTTELCKTALCPMLCYPTTIKTFLESLSTDDFTNVLTELYKHQQQSLAVDCVSNVCELWSVVLSAQTDKDKSTLRQKMLLNTLNDCQPLLQQHSHAFHPSVLHLLHSICVSKSISLDYKLLDLVLVILGTVPTADAEACLLPDSLSVLHALISVRAELMFDRVPAFLQRLRLLLKSLVLLSDKDKGYNVVATSAVNQLTRIIKTMTDQHAKHFARTAPYLVADFLHLLVTFPVEASVKYEMENSVCHLLSICDHHGCQLLQNVLPVASTEVFKTVSTTFRKSFKYTGKV